MVARPNTIVKPFSSFAGDEQSRYGEIKFHERSWNNWAENQASNSRRPAARLDWQPPPTIKPITKFLSQANSDGALPWRVWQASSPSVTSRRQGNPFSMPQCARTIRSKPAALASSLVKLLMP